MKCTRACGRLYEGVRTAEQRLARRFEVPFRRHPVTAGRQQVRARAHMEAQREELARVLPLKAAERKPDSMYMQNH